MKNFTRYRSTKLPFKQLRYTFVLFLACTLLPFAVSAQSSDSVKAQELAWEVETIAGGIEWKSYLGDDLFDARLSINVIKIDLDAAGASMKIAFERDDLVKTSEFAEKYGALAAINGSFFNPRAGGAVVFLRVDGTIISEGAGERNPYTENGGIGWGEDGMITILAKPDDGWQNVVLGNLMSSGPLLIYNGKQRNFRNDPFHENRHPRTAVAITQDNNLLLITVDGRSFQSYGMTIPELAEFLESMGAVDALNLDGGGSTAMWIKDKKTDGIVNYPSDNFEFDHEGERRVSNALLLLNN
ncbi:MAG: phosphodiester glycosidase family protein [Balneolaceae bacterium]|nr:MAG: phosphodiester glycosidase family protein [Balneolaceae bacterium]